MLNRDGILSQLHTHRYGQELLLADSIPSTNTRLKELAAQGAAEGCTLIADTQTEGRGRRGRWFLSPQGGLYLSTLLRPSAPLDPGVITCYAAVAAARAIESLCDAPIDIKWVNDLYLKDRKVAGILAEGVLSPDGELTAVVLGIGINVTGRTPPQLEGIATTLEEQGAVLTREALAAAFLNQWERVYPADQEGDVMEEYRRRNLVLGRAVTVVQGEDTYPATAIAITEQGHLRVTTAAGERELTSGEVSLRL